MTTTKEFGCGGRYSAYQFVPCNSCSAGNLAACLGVQEMAGLAHYEWFTDLTGRVKWRATRPEKAII